MGKRLLWVLVVMFEGGKRVCSGVWPSGGAGWLLVMWAGGGVVRGVFFFFFFFK